MCLASYVDLSSLVLIGVMVGVVMTGFASLLSAAFLLRRNKVAYNTQVCFDRIKRAGFTRYSTVSATHRQSYVLA